uniref:acetyl-CoA C-acyltransferase n=1 Tax=Spumella elongata TaxID=89044 RepID=A0A7S3M7M8_9STRA
MGGTVYGDYMAVDLARFALKGLLTKTALDPKSIDYLYYGTVIQEPRTSNIAREASMGAGIPISVPSSTVTMACISSNLAITSGAEKILSGQADIIVAGGAETFSDVPIRFSKPIRKRLLGVAKASKKGIPGYLGLLKGLKLGDLAPEAPAIANFTTGEVMGHSSDRLAAKFGVSRKDQDEFTVRSHLNAAAAHAKGLYKNEIIPVDGNVTENGIKGDTSYEKVAKLNPAFIKPHGTHTAANSSFLTDGATATLIMSEEKALELGYKPKAYIRSWAYVGVDPFEELLLGPTFATAKVLQHMKLSLNDIGVIEFHEAFAGQVLANMAAMGSEKFCADRLPGGKVVGNFDFSKVNTRGGSLSLGHPFGATGARLVTTASNRLQEEGHRFALLTACADGGLAHACILERYDNK